MTMQNSPSVLTFQDLIIHLKADSELPAGRLRNVVSAIRTFIKAAGCTLQTEASVPVVRRALSTINARGHGFNKRHLSIIG